MVTHFDPLFLNENIIVENEIILIQAVLVNKQLFRITILMIFWVCGFSQRRWSLELLIFQDILHQLLLINWLSFFTLFQFFVFKSMSCIMNLSCIGHFLFSSHDENLFFLQLLFLTWRTFSICKYGGKVITSKI